MRKAPASSHLHPQREREADGPAGAAGTAVGAMPAFVPKGHFRTIPLLKMLQLKHIAGAIIHAGPAPLAVPAVHTARGFGLRLFLRVAFVDLPEGQPFPDALTLRFGPLVLRHPVDFLKGHHIGGLSPGETVTRLDPAFFIDDIDSGVFPGQVGMDAFSLDTRSIIPPRLLSFSSNLSYPL